MDGGGVLEHRAQEGTYSPTPRVIRPPSPVMSISTSSANTSARPSQSFVSISRKYRAFSRLMASMSPDSATRV
jgi:hypothetical protein